MYACDTVTNNDPADQLSDIIVMDAYIGDEMYSVLLENKFSNIKVPGEVFISETRIPVYFEPQGAGSRYFTKWGYTITCRNGYTIKNLSRFNLSLQQYDKTKARTALASWLYRQTGFPVFNSDHCLLKVNNDIQGLYVLTERIEDGFFERRNINPYELIKVVFGAKFTYNQLNTLVDNFEKKIPDDGNFNNLAELINAIDTTKAEFISDLQRYLDINEYLRYHALTTIMNNSDGITNNFYLYKKKPNLPYQLIPWDFDKTFDPKARLQLYSGNELMDKLMKNKSFKTAYENELINILNNLFTEENLFPIIDSVHSKISSAYSLDPYLRNVVSLDNEINNLKLFIISRREYLLQELDL